MDRIDSYALMAEARRLRTQTINRYLKRLGTWLFAKLHGAKLGGEVEAANRLYRPR